MSAKLAFAIAVGGALGATSRYGALLWARAALGDAFPFGTLVVNVVGSGLLGVVSALALRDAGLSPCWSVGLSVGFLGAFTTFSAFSFDAYVLMQSGRVSMALAYVAASVLLSIGAFAAAHWLARGTA